MNQRVIAVGLLVVLGLTVWWTLTAGDARDRFSLEGEGRAAPSELTPFAVAADARRDEPPIPSPVRPEAVVPEAREDEAASGPVLSVRLAVARDGKPAAEVVEIEAAFSASLSPLDLQTTPPLFLRAAFLPVASARVSAPDAVALTVPERGHYRLRARVTGHVGWSAWEQNTEQDEVHVTLAFVSALRVRVAHPPPSEIVEVFARPDPDESERPVSARLVDVAVWELEDEVVLPVAVAIRVRGWPHPLWTTVRSQDAEISLAGLGTRSVAVRDAWSDAVIGDAAVTVAFREAHVRVPVDADGVAVIPYASDPLDRLLRFNGYALHVQAPGYARATIANLESLPLGEDGLSVVSLLREGCPGGRLIRSTGESVAGARVYLVTAESTVAQGTCDEDGRFVLAPGTFGGNVATRTDPSAATLSSAGVGCHLVVRDVGGAMGLIGPLDWRALAVGEWAHTVGSPRDWEVDLRDAVTDEPVAGASVRAALLAGDRPLLWLGSELATGRSDAAGRVQLGRVLPSRWRLEIEASGYSSRTHDVEPTPDAARVLRLDRAAPIRLRLIDAQRRALPGVRVSLHARSSRPLAATSNAEGRVDFAVDSGERFLYSVSRTDLVRDLDAPMYLAADDVERDVRLVGQRRVALVFVDERGDAVERALVLLRGPSSGGPVRTIERVPFLPDALLPADVLEIRAVAPGQAPSEWRLVRVDELSDPPTIELVLGPGFAVAGRLPADLLIGGVEVLLDPVAIRGMPGPAKGAASLESRWFRVTAVVEKDGRFRFGRVTPGSYRLRVRTNAVETDVRDLVVEKPIDLGLIEPR